MNKNKVNVTQLSLLLLLVITGGKFLSLPSILAKDVGHDSWLVLTVALLWDAVSLCFVLWAVKINKQQLSFDKILNTTLSKVGSTLVLLVFFVMFMCRIMVLLDSCYNTFAVTFDVNTNWLVFMFPIVGIAAFAISRGFNSVARTAQILFTVIFFAIVALLIYPLTKASFSQLLPIGEIGWGNIFRTAFLRSFWFSDYVFVYFLMENIKRQKHLFCPVLVSFAVGVAFTVLLNAVFMSLFGSMAQYGNIAMSKIGMFSVSESTDGRWDWITLSVWLTSVVIKIIVFIFCAYKCIEKIFQLHFAKTNFVALGFISAILLVPMFVPINVVINKFVYWCLAPFALVQYLLPLLMPLLTKISNNKQRLLQGETQ